MDEAGRGRRRLVTGLVAGSVLALAGFGLSRGRRQVHGQCAMASRSIGNDARPMPVSAIIVCAFGYRLNEAGLRLPGRVNNELARVCDELFRQFMCPVYAQWEVAQVLDDNIPRDTLTAIFPQVDRQNGQPEYLSTAGVIRQAKGQMSAAAESGRVLIVAHRDHVCRCVDLARRAGLDADAAPALPSGYDPLSQQWWTRDPWLYRSYDQLAWLIG